jgi:N-acetylneuraminic acid mutarotase
MKTRINVKHLSYPFICLLLIISLYAVSSGLQISFSQNQNQESYWVRGIDMPTPRTEVTSTNIGESIYVIGGFTPDEEITDMVEMFNSTSKSWNQDISPLPIPLHHTVANTYQDKIYVVGGYTGDWIPSNKLFIYDPVANDWTEGNPMLTPRGSPNANFVNATLYVIGGDLDGNPVSAVEKYDVVTGEWTTSLAPMPTPRHHAASAVVDGNIYVMGGRLSGEMINVDLIEKYDPILDKWTVNLEPMPSKRSGVVATSLNGFIYAIGGEQIQGTMDAVERYDPINNKWTKELPMPTPRHGLGVTSLDDMIYAIAGGTQPGMTFSSINEIYMLEINTTR